MRLPGVYEGRFLTRSHRAEHSFNRLIHAIRENPSSAFAIFEKIFDGQFARRLVAQLLHLAIMALWWRCKRWFTLRRNCCNHGELSLNAEESITRWIDGIRNGEDEAALQIWDAFFDRLLAIARNRLQTTQRSVRDEEDIVLSAFKSFCAGIRQGRFPQLRDREDLWRILFVITARKVSDEFAFQRREKRDIRREVSSANAAVPFDAHESPFFVSTEPSPQFAAECADQLRYLLDQLQHPDLQRIAILKMEGYTNQEIAHQFDRGITTIERKLRTIREIWSQPNV